MKLVKLIYNPYSGDTNIHKELDTIIEVYQSYGFSITPFRISSKIQLNKAFTDLARYEHILVAGGDGTINNVVNKMKELGFDLPLAVLPTGTANDFANCLGIPKNIRAACKKILSSEPRYIDLGKINDKYFINVASMGLFTDVSQKINANLKNTIGNLAYYVSGIKEIQNFRRLNLKISTKDFVFNDPSLIVFLFNGRTAGNLNIAYNSELDDGFLDLVIVKGNVSKDTLISLFEFIRKEHLEDPKGVIHLKSDYIRIESDQNIPTDIDGEKGPMFPLEITCEKDAIRVLGYN